MAEKQFRKRNAILSYLQNTDTHPGAETIYADLKAEYPDISLGTVYRNLTLFKQQGLVTSLGTVNGVERFDGNTAPHVHFICTECDGVTDLMHMDAPGELCRTVEDSTGGQVALCSLSFIGTCKNCRSNNI